MIYTINNNAICIMVNIGINVVTDSVVSITYYIYFIYNIYIYYIYSVYIYIIHTHIYTYPHIHTYICTHICTHIHIRTRTHARTVNTLNNVCTNHSDGDASREHVTRV